MLSFPLGGILYISDYAPESVSLIFCKSFMRPPLRDSICQPVMLDG